MYVGVVELAVEFVVEAFGCVLPVFSVVSRFLPHRPRSPSCMHVFVIFLKVCFAHPLIIQEFRPVIAGREGAYAWTHLQVVCRLVDGVV